MTETKTKATAATLNDAAVGAIITTLTRTGMVHERTETGETFRDGTAETNIYFTMGVVTVVVRVPSVRISSEVK